MHNTIAEFVARTIMCASALGLHYVLEQPMASLLVKYPQAGHACCYIVRVWFACVSVCLSVRPPVRMYVR
eukprot:718874-Alexandrium_andersonii.AAC.1